MPATIQRGQASRPAAVAKLDGAGGKEDFPGLDMVRLCAAARWSDRSPRLVPSRARMRPRQCCRRQVEKECEYLFKAKVGPLHACQARAARLPRGASKMQVMHQVAGAQECAEDMPFARTETFSPKLEEMMNCCIGCALPCAKRCDRSHAPRERLGGHAS